MSLILSGSDGVSDIDGSASTPAIRGTDTNTGIFFGSDIIGFSEDGTEVMRINSDGNVLIGGTQSLAKLTVNNGIVAVDESGVGTKQVYIRSNYSAVGPAIQVSTNDPLLFVTNNNERMRIDSSGNLLVGTTSHADGSIFQSSATALNSYRTTATTGSGIFGLYSDVGGTKTVRAYFTADGGLANYSANNTNLSDERLKKDIVLANNYLDKLCAIPVKNFRYKDQDASEDITLGVIAQDVQAVAPELVNTDGFGVDGIKADYLAVYQTDLQYAMLKAIQEQQAIITDLKSRIETLEAK
jgi:hypothetical protein